MAMVTVGRRGFGANASFDDLRIRFEDEAVRTKGYFAGRGGASAGFAGAMLDPSPQAPVASPPPYVVPVTPAILTSLLSDVPYVASGTTPNAYANWFLGCTVGAGANVRFTAVFASGQTPSADSTLLLSNGEVATLAGTKVDATGATVATYIYAVAATDQAAAALSVTGLVNGGQTYAANVDAFLTIDPTIESPSDQLYSGEWYIHGTYGTHADKVWPDYTGKGVVVASFDGGMEYAHPDLAPNIDVAAGYDPFLDKHNGSTSTAYGDAATYPASWAGNSHGTAAVGLIAAARNGIGSVGVAYDATLYSMYLYYGSTAPAGTNFETGYANALLDAAQHADVMTFNVQYNRVFQMNFASPSWDAVGAAFETAAKTGRDGLGLSVVVAGGNYNLDYAQDTNSSSLSNSPYAIVDFAVSGLGRKYSYSNPGASILVGAGGGGMISTDRLGPGGYNTATDGDYTDTSTSWFSGTSSATPTLAGVVALIYDANAKLGARDVQEILAYSAAPVQAGDYDRFPVFFNGAANWNNGGLRVSNNYGYGIADARAAVRLAETWTTQKTWNNVVEQTGAIAAPATMALTGTGSESLTRTIHIAADQTIDRADLKIDIDTAYPEFLTITLTSPDGTVSILADRIGMNFGTNQLIGSYQSYNGLHFTLDSTQFMGEHAAGDWTVTVTSTSYGPTETYGGGGETLPSSIPVTLQNAALTVRGDAVDPNTTYIYTDAYAGNGFNGTTLADADGGYDTINAAAVTGVVSIDLSGAGTSSIGGRELVVADDHIWRVFGGDAGDTLTGSDTTPTLLSGMRGADTLTGGSATAMLIGGAGNDTLTGGAGFSIAGYAGSASDFVLSMANGQWTIAGGAEGSDTCAGVDWASFSDGVFALNDDGTATRLTGTACDLSLDPALGLGLAETAAGFLAYSGALAADAGALSSLVITDATALTLDVNTLLGAAPLLDLIADVAFTLGDTAAAIGASIADLGPLGEALTSVAITDAQTIHIAQVEYQASIEIVSRITGDYTLAVALDNGGTQLFARRGTVDTMTMLDAGGHKTSVTTVDPAENYENVVRTYSGGRIVSAEFNGVFDRSYNHLVRQYEDGHVVLEKRDGFSGGDLTMRLAAYDENGTLRTLTSTFTGRDYQTLSLGYDADGHLATRTRDGFDGPVSSITGFYDADGTAYATRTAMDDGTSRLVGSASGNALSLALADTIRGRDGADTFTVSADEANGAILDFDRAGGDRIDLSQLFGSADDAHFIKDAAFGGHAGEVRFDRVDGGVLVQIDLNGDALADTSFAMNGARVLATDFVF